MQQYFIPIFDFNIVIEYSTEDFRLIRKICGPDFMGSISENRIFVFSNWCLNENP